MLHTKNETKEKKEKKMKDHNNQKRKDEAKPERDQRLEKMNDHIITIPFISEKL